MKDFSFDIESFRQGNKQVFEYIFENLYQSLCFFINRFINKLPEAEDIAQETFLILWNHRQEMSSATHIKSFLYLTARNITLDYLRHEKIINNYTEQAIPSLESTENFIHFIIEEEVEQILLKTEENLPKQCKQIFVLTMQGKENEEIASLLNISVNTVKTQKKIAYKKLKHYISELGMIILSIP